MAKFPLITAEPRGLPRATIPSAGAELVPQAIMGAGEAIASLGVAVFNIQQERQRLKDTQASIAADSYTNAATSRGVTFRNANGNTDLWGPQVDSEYNDLKTQVGGLSMSPKRRAIVNARLEAWYTQESARVQGLALTKDVKDTQEAAYRSYVDAAASGDFLGEAIASRGLAEAYAKTTTPEQLEAIRRRAKSEGETKRRVANTRARVEQKQLLEARQEADRLQLYTDMYVATPLDPATGTFEPVNWDRIQKTSLPAKEQIRLFEEYQKYLKEMDEAGVSLIANGSPGVRAEVLQRIYTNPTGLTPGHIWSATKKWRKRTDRVLGTKHVPSLIKTLRAEQERKVAPFRLPMQTAIGALYSAGAFGDKDSPEAANRYISLSNNLSGYLDKVPPPSRKEVEEYVYDQLRMDMVKLFGGLRYRELKEDELPGVKDEPIEVPIPDRMGRPIPYQTRLVKVIKGTEIIVDGVRLKAVGKKGGEVDWQPLKPR